MIEVSLYMHPELHLHLGGRYSGMRDAIITSVWRSMKKHVEDNDRTVGMTISTAIYFQVRTAQVLDKPMWFVGAVGLIKVFENYYVLYLVGANQPLVEGNARDYLSMDRLSQEVYSKHFVPEPMLMYKLAYETPIAQLSPAIFLEC